LYDPRERGVAEKLNIETSGLKARQRETMFR